jgi:hypothetical protein
VAQSSLTTSRAVRAGQPTPTVQTPPLPDSGRAPILNKPVLAAPHSN